MEYLPLAISAANAHPGQLGIAEQSTYLFFNLSVEDANKVNVKLL
jgi:hypothetical protein